MHVKNRGSVLSKLAQYQDRSESPTLVLLLSIQPLLSEHEGEEEREREPQGRDEALNQQAQP